jgi:hypothetical protein
LSKISWVIVGTTFTVTVAGVPPEGNSAMSVVPVDPGYVVQPELPLQLAVVLQLLVAPPT